MGTRARNRTMLIFGALAFYIVLQFAWWAWLLISKDNDLRALHSELDALGVRSTTSTRTADQTFWMVIGEGSVFVAMLLVALWLTWRTVRHELMLARAQRNFLLAVSHELRTPIAGLKLHLQTLGRADINETMRSELVGRSLGDTDRLSALTEKILLTTRLEEHELPLQLEAMDIRTFVQQVVDNAQRSYGREHRITVPGKDVPSARLVQADPIMLHTILDNLLENACKYAPAGSTVEVSLSLSNGRCELRVSDEGPGISPEEREHVFRKFHRSGNEGTRTAKGTGLGLYIVRGCLRRLGGSVRMEPRLPQGSIFVAEFPIS